MSKNALTRREFLKALGTLAGVTLAPTSENLSLPQPSAANELFTLEDKRPNVIYIMADQLRAASVGCYGNSEISTPFIDGIAAQGARFANCASTSPLCSPHRACLMTGRYPTVTGVTRNSIKLPGAETCIAEVFHDCGYITQYIGKWHLDGPIPESHRDPGWVAPKDRQGFQKWSAFNFAHRYYGSQYYLNNDPILQHVPVDQYEPDWQTEQAINFITQNQDRKFFLFLSIGTPHPVFPPLNDLPPGGDYTFPYDPNGLTLRPNVDYPDQAYARQGYADYYGITSNFDWNVGRILSTLDLLGIANNTIVVVSSDHGDILGSHSGEYILFRGKGRIESESLSVPFILRYPLKIAAQVVNDVFTSVDIMPTLLGMCKLPVPSGVMGRDFSPRLRNGRSPIQPPYGALPSTEAILVGLWLDNEKAWVGVRSPKYTLACAFDTLIPTKLFHDTRDPYQMNNLVDKPAYQLVKEALYQDLLAWLDYIEPG
jgi:arylsulfatase A-like enzyme